MEKILKTLKQIIMKEFLHLTCDEFKPVEKIILHFSNKKIEL